MRHHLATFLILSAVIVIGTGAIIAQQPAQKPPTPEEQAALMKKYQEMSQPGPEHQRLAQLEGKWDYTVKMWMSPESGNPMVIQGKSESKMVLGGRFLESKSTSSMMGMPFERLSYYGFDRRTNEYTSIGFDNFGTYFETSKGKYDEKTGAIILYGEDFDPIMNVTKKYKFKLNLKDKDAYTIEMIFTDSVMSQGTGEFKMMDISYTRAK